jgi:fatty-acyl-CoA synthase
VQQRTVMANAAAVARHGLSLRDGDRGVSWLPLYHDMGLVGFFLIPLACQVSVDLLPTREFARRPLVWLDLISRNRGTLAYSPSFGYELCARRAESAPPDLDLSSWRAAGVGGDMIRPQVLEKFAARLASHGFRSEAFVASYGMAEATLALSFAALGCGIRKDVVKRWALEHQGFALPCTSDEAADGRAFVRCGPILPGHWLEVRDEQGRVLPERRVGTIFVRGPSIMHGYHGHIEETQRVLSAGGWLNTGDLGYVADDEIVVTGRAKDLIIVNGRNIWPQDLEWTAEAGLPALRSHDVVVFSVDGEATERVIASLREYARA